MMTSKRTIIIKEGEKIIHEGPDRRSYSNESSLSSSRPIILGMFSVKEFIGFCCYGVTVAVFLLIADKRINIIEKNQEMFMEFIYNSDNYHASILRTQFRNGKPVNDSFDSKKISEILSEAVEENKNSTKTN